MKQILCSKCGEPVSSKLPDNIYNDLVIRAFIECPDCIERQLKTNDRALLEEMTNEIAFLVVLDIHGEIIQGKLKNLLARAKEVLK